MSDPTLQTTFGQLKNRGGSLPSRLTPDQDLLARFRRERDEQAFATLMERHGPMVMGICRRILKNAHDAEDACQAVFLVLARRAGSIQKNGSVASWLHGVAWRMANKLRTSLARRTNHQAAAAAQKPTAMEAGDMSLREIQRLVDEELNRLPRTYRDPLVLCYLQGKTQDEAARELGWSLGTLRGKLERGRKLLRERLTKMGVTGASALTLGALLPNLSSATVPPALVAATAKASVPLAASGAIPAAVPAKVAALAREALQSTWLTTYPIVALVGLLAVALGLVAFFTAEPEIGTGPTPVQPRALEVWSQLESLEVPNPHVWSVAFSPDGKRIAAGSRKPLDEEGELRIWDADTLEVLYTVQTQRGVRCVIFAPHGKTLATVEHDGAARLRDAVTGSVLFLFPGRGSQNDGAAFSPDGKILAISYWNGTVKLWDTTTGEEIRTLDGHTGQVFTVGFGKLGNDTILASGGSDKLAWIWSAETGKPLFLLQGHEGVVHWLTFSPDGRTLATASWDKSVKLWDTATGSLKATLRGHTETVLTVAFSPDAKTLASTATKRLEKGSPSEVILWDLTAKKARARFQVKDRAYGLAFSPDGNTLAVSSFDGTVAFWKHQPDADSAQRGDNLQFVVAANQDRAAGSPPRKEYAKDYHPAFKEGLQDIPGLLRYGPDAPECVKVEPNGLRIKLPAGYPRPRPGTGVVTDFGVKGDFEITANFEILQWPSDAAPGANLANLSLVVVPHERAEPDVWHKADKNRACLVREIVGSNHAGQFLASFSRWTHDIPRDKWGNENFSKVEEHTNFRSPATAKKGRLRLIRSGSDLYFFTNENSDVEFKLLAKIEFGTRDLKNIRLLATTNGPEGSFEVRITDLQVRADSFVNPSAPLQRVTEASRPKWLLISLAVAVPALLLGGWLLVRMRRSTAPANPSEDTPADLSRDLPEVSQSILFLCPDCGTRLKAKSERAGGKVKCPKCAHAIKIPKKKAGEAEEST